MSFARSIWTQFGKPHGFWGSVAGRIMASRPSNIKRNEWTLELLEILPEHRILEIGFGPGIAVQRAAQLASRGEVIGIDHSETMLKQARKRNAPAIAAGRVTLLLGTVADLPQFPSPFDRIYTVNSAQFWPDTHGRFRILRTLLKPGGRIAVTHQPRNPGATERDTEESGNRIRQLLIDAGFRNVRIEWKPMKPVAVVCVLGEAEVATEVATTSPMRS